jgi:hypothetical protein
MQSRRQFIRTVSLTGAALLVGSQARADLPMVDEKDPLPQSLKYVSDATKSKDPKYVPGSHCGNCVLFQGKPTDKAGPCPLYAGKWVATAGWCASYSKKG